MNDLPASPPRRMYSRIIQSTDDSPRHRAVLLVRVHAGKLDSSSSSAAGGVRGGTQGNKKLPPSVTSQFNGAHREACSYHEATSFFLISDLVLVPPRLSPTAASAPRW